MDILYTHDAFSVLAASIMLSCLFFYLYSEEKAKYLKIWGFSWTFASLRYVFEIFILSGYKLQILVFIKLFLTLISGVLLILGLSYFFGKFKKMWVYSVFFASSAVVFYLMLAGVHIFYLNTFVFSIMMIIYIYSGVVIIRNRKKIGSGSIVSGVAMILWGIHKGDYPLAVHYNAFIPFGYQLAVVFTMATSLGFILMHMEQIRKKEKFLGSFFSNLNISKDLYFYSFTLEPYLSFDHFSESVFDVLGYTFDDISNNEELLLQLTGLYKDKDFYKEIYDGEGNPIIQVKDANGKNVWIELNNNINYDISGRMISVTGIGRDISEKQEKKYEIIKRKEWYEGLFKNSGLVMLLLDPQDGSVVDANLSAINFYGLKDTDVNFIKLEQIVHGDKAELFSSVNDVLQNGKSTMRCVQKVADGSLAEVLVFCTKIFLSDKVYVHLSVLDRRMERELENRLCDLESMHSVLLNSMDEGVFIIDNKSKIQFANNSAYAILGFPKEEILNQNLHDALHMHTGNPNMSEEKCLILDYIERGLGLHEERSHFSCVDGSVIPVKFSINSIEGDGYAKGGILVFRDISKELMKEEKLVKSVEEKSILLKEIHHRVKNNLQIVSSLLSMQSSYVEDSEAVVYFENSIQRIKSMALIHEMLYRSDNISELNFSEYMEKLINQISMSYASTMHINFETDFDNVKLNIDESISLSLLVTEVITNCYKHAFLSENDNNIIRVHLKKLDTGKRFLLIEDNGVGIESKEQFINSGSLGAQIIMSLSSQLGGELDIHEGNGTSFKLVF